jgi:hypothetical protein
LTEAGTVLIFCFFFIKEKESTKSYNSLLGTSFQFTKFSAVDKSMKLESDSHFSNIFVDDLSA